MAAPNRDPKEQMQLKKVTNDIKNLDKRLAELIESEGGKGRARVSFGFSVLRSVSQGHYDHAAMELDNVGHGLEDFHDFNSRVGRYVEHAKSLISAIRIKHKIGSSPNVNKSKQKELSDKIAEHFLELKKTIIIIEKIQKSVRTDDLSSTSFFVETIYFSLAGVFLTAVIYFGLPEMKSLTWSFVMDFFTFSIF